MKDEYDRLVKSARYSRISQLSAVGLLCLGIGSSLYIGVTGRTQEVVKVLIPMSLGLGIVGTASGIVADQSEEVLKDWCNISDQQTTNRVYQQLEPEVPTVALPKARVYYFQWEILAAQRDNYPHIQIVVKSGGGKSTLAEYLCGLLGGSTIAVAPHYQIGDYPSANAIVGAGRNLGDEVPKDTKYTLDNLLEGQQVTATEAIRVLASDMGIRYQLDSEGMRRSGDEVNVILDEYPSYAGKPGVAEAILEVLREARKVDLRMVIITQSDLGGAMNLSEQDKRNLTTIRLKDEAIDHARYLLNREKPGTEKYEVAYEVYEAVSQMSRPCMVDNSPAIIPEVVRE